MTTRVPTIRLPIDFTNSPDFQTLRLATRDDVAPLLGRVLALAIAMTELRRSKLHASEVDAICAWTGRGDSFVEYLDRVGWARRDMTGSTAEIRLPDLLDPFTPNRLNGLARSQRAERDDKGRYLRSSKPRPPKRAPGVEVNADGDVVAKGGRP
jgi:hypothetical protein